MANKKSLLKGMRVKVENRSGFDKSRFNALTTGVGTITPIAKQLLIPSSGRLSVKLSAQLPPLATDAYLRTHLKIEAFFVPMRIMYSGFESWYSGKEHYDAQQEEWVRCNLPRVFVPFFDNDDGAVGSAKFNPMFAAGSLTDYFGAKFPKTDENTAFNEFPTDAIIQGEQSKSTKADNPVISGVALNLWPYIAYAMIYDHFYRNKNIQRPLFSPPTTQHGGSFGTGHDVFSLPWQAYMDKVNVVPTTLVDSYLNVTPEPDMIVSDKLLDGSSVFDLRQRNYGDDYFTCALPQPSFGADITVDTSGGNFTISALRTANAAKEFSDNNRFASPDMQAVNLARYGVDLSDALAQHPVLLGSADFTMFTSGVEQTANTDDVGGWNNPWREQVGARYGRAHAEGTDFVCDFDVKEPGYLMVLATLVPEANYAFGVSKDMKIFTKSGDLVDLPVGLLEHTGPEPILGTELDFAGQMDPNGVFGYAPQRYLWHKAGQVNEVHGLFRKGYMLESFIPQRAPWNDDVNISTDFLQVATTDLDNLLAADTIMSGDVENSQVVMIDSAIELFVSEPLAESALPALSNPALEHGRSVYLNTGGSKLA